LKATPAASIAALRAHDAGILKAVLAAMQHCLGPIDEFQQARQIV
jgi:hypothetical protein